MSIETKRCEEEYQKNSKLNKDDIQQIQEWLKKQPHLPKLNEYAVIQFYDSSGLSIQKTKTLIETHYQFKNDAPELFTGKDYEPPRYKHSYWDCVYCIDLPKRSVDGYQLVYCGFKDPDPAKFHLEIGIAMFIKVMMTILLIKGTCSGYAFIFDIKGVVLSHFATVTISLVKKFLFFVQEAIPLKVKAVHIIHVNPLVDKIMMLTKPFLKKELYDMIHIQSDMNHFYKEVGKECIPTDLGGTLPFTRDELVQQTKAKVIEFDDVIDKELHLFLDESKRVDGKSRDVLMMNGSFKKLNID
ncbi:hypothetical protein PGB90_006209 [Kerria lacca]